jgi:hypothetical protein
MLAVQFVFPMIGVRMNMAENFGATSIMTVVSLARSYFWRRLFARIHSRYPLPSRDHAARGE